MKYQTDIHGNDHLSTNMYHYEISKNDILYVTLDDGKTHACFTSSEHEALRRFLNAMHNKKRHG